MKIIRLLSAIAVLSVAFTGAKAAVTIGNSNVQIGGFFSQGWMSSSGNNYPFKNEGGTFDFREMGLNVSTTIGSHLRLGAQGFAQRLGNYGEDKVKIDWAVADYNFRPEFGIRAGRVKLPNGLYGEALDLDSIRPFVFLPITFYNPVMRDFISAVNGAEIYGSLDFGKSGSLDYKIFYGNLKIDREGGVADWILSSRIISPSLSSVGYKSSRGFHFLWSTPISGLKTGISYMRNANFSAKGPSPMFANATAAINLPAYEYKTAFAEYTTGSWTFASEYQTLGGDTEIVLPIVTQRANTKKTIWYISAARRLNDKFEVGTYYSSQENNTPQAGSSSDSNHNHSWVASVRYDVNEHVLIKAEVHSISGYMDMINTTRTPNNPFERHTTLFAVKTTLSF